jgi:hypothetical protein
MSVRCRLGFHDEEITLILPYDGCRVRCRRCGRIGTSTSYEASGVCTIWDKTS